MDRLISRKNGDLLHYDEVGWTNLCRQYRRVLKSTGTNGTGTYGKDSTSKDFDTATIIGVVYVGVLIALMLVYLT